MAEIHIVPVPRIHMASTAGTWEVIVGRIMTGRTIRIANGTVVEIDVVPVTRARMAGITFTRVMVCRTGMAT